MRDLYNTNQDFRNYVDRYLKQYPEKTLDEVLQHKMIKQVAEYYDKGGVHRNDYITIKN